MGGSVSVESKEGVGTEYILNIKTKCIVKSPTADAHECKARNSIDPRTRCFIEKKHKSLDIDTCI